MAANLLLRLLPYELWHLKRMIFPRSYWFSALYFISQFSLCLLLVTYGSSRSPSTQQSSKEDRIIILRGSWRIWRSLILFSLFSQFSTLSAFTGVGQEVIAPANFMGFLSRQPTQLPSQRLLS